MQAADAETEDEGAGYAHGDMAGDSGDDGAASDHQPRRRHYEYLNRQAARRNPALDEAAGPPAVSDAADTGGAAGGVRRQLNPALAPTFRHPLWGHPNIPGGG